MDSTTFKAAMSRWATGITVITTVDAQGAPTGFTASSFSSLSLEPPLVLFCLGRESTNFETFRRARAFAVNVLGSEQQALSNRFAARGGDKFAELAYRPGMDGVPLLDGCLAALECRVLATHEGGDHLIFVGQVERGNCAEGEPLLYFGGGYRRLASP